MSPGVTARTRVFAVLGHPVAHSLSPVFQGAALDARGIDAVYVALDCDEDRVVGLVRGLAAAGGGGNVTLPHKERVAAILEAPTPEVERTGACNTFWSDADGRLAGDNTDVTGFRGALRGLREGGGRGARVVLVGAGGAARAALAGLVDDGAAEILLVNRSADRARALADRLGGSRTRILDDPRDLRGADLDLVVNATRLGLDHHDPLPFDLALPARVGAVFDLVYGAVPTAFVEAAREHGIPALDGVEMLLRQGEAAFRRWFGDPVPLEAMRAALAAGA